MTAQVLPIHTWQRLCDAVPAFSTLVDSGAESAHKCGIATLAEEYPEESSAKTRERDTGQRLPRELLGQLVNRLPNAATETVQQARAGLRSFLPPAPSHE